MTTEPSIRSILGAGVAACLLIVAGGAGAQDSAESDSKSHEAGIPLAHIIAAVARKSGKSYLIDPRVHADVQLVGQDVSNVTSAQLLTILQLHGFAAIEGGGYVRIVPESAIRQMALPQVSGNERYPDAQFVSAVIPVRNGPAGYLVPILRPLIPQIGQLAAVYCANYLLIVDSFANVKRIENLVHALDTGTPYKPEKCEMPNPATHREGQ
jgi:type II secretory pathway component GspD/PulD (secretin)